LIKRLRFPKIFFGWWMVLSTGILSGLAQGFYMQGASVLFKPIASDLSLNRAAASVASSIGTLQSGVSFPLAGWLSDRIGPKWVIIAGISLTGIGMVLMNFIASPWSYYIIWGLLIGMGEMLAYSVAIDTMLTNWFISKRGLVFSVRFTIIGIMAVIVLPLLSWLVVAQGWRTSCLIWAGVAFAGIPVALYFVRQRRPEYYGLLPDGAGADSGSTAGTEAMVAKGVEYAASFQETEFTLRQAMRTSPYWILTVAWIVLTTVRGGLSIHIIPFLTDMGVDPIVAGSIMAMMTFFAIPSQFLGGLIAGRIKKDKLKFLLAGPLLFSAAGITIFLLSSNLVGVYIFLILFGFGSGAYTPVDIIIRSRYFGRKAYGSIQGSAMLFSAPISFLAPIYAGWVYDATGTYTPAFTLFAAIAASAGVMMCLSRVPKLPNHTGDTRRIV
jgi:MFS family permease